MAGSNLCDGLAVPDPYYSSGVDLKAKNEPAASEGPDVPGLGLAHIDLSSLTTALDVGAGWGGFGGHCWSEPKPSGTWFVPTSPWGCSTPANS